MSFQNSWEAPQSHTLEGMNWLPQTSVMSSENYLPCEIDDILQWLPVDQNPQLLFDPTYDSVHMSTLGWSQEDNLLSYSAMLLDDPLRTLYILSNLSASVVRCPPTPRTGVKIEEM
ncbi:hypothetical protein CC78DRAFT_586274 [Lojkania enalia]|uniref:Uncharacterized protein n=1 Tax=Lojkania enalia TaxID=147567 RepID=A0A9P4K0C3_9PLEO|nr:hypothetical protein CC78DRAFT_586274 [Didymosphaeria enalia]